MKRKELEAERGMKRRRLESPPAAEDSGGKVQKDVCICVRLVYVAKPQNFVRWLKIKIPGLLLDKLQDCSSSCEYDGITATPVGSLFVKDKSYVIEGPFEFKCHVTGDPKYPCTARCAAIGSVMYALGGDQSHIQGFFDYLCESEGTTPATPNDPAPKSNITDFGLSTGGKPTFTYTGVNLRTNVDVEMSNSFDFCDFSDPSPQWKLGSQPLLCPRYRPKVVSLNGKLFAFGGNRRDSDTPFAEVFDPNVGYWQPLPNPPFEWVFDFELCVFPLVRINRIFLVATYSGFQYTFDPSTGLWYRIDSCPDLTRYLYYSRIYGEVVPVVSVYHETIYWVGPTGVISMYNLPEQRYQTAYVTGLCNPKFGGNGYLRRKRIMVLHPLSENLLGIFWCKFNPFDRGTSLDLVIFRLSPITDADASPLSSHHDMETKVYFDEKTTTMTASVVDFLSVPVHDYVTGVVDAHDL